MTNIGKTKEEIIFELVLSLNKGDSGYLWSGDKATPRVNAALAQYEALVEKGVIREE